MKKISIAIAVCLFFISCSTKTKEKPAYVLNDKDTGIFKIEVSNPLSGLNGEYATLTSRVVVVDTLSYTGIDSTTNEKGEVVYSQKKAKMKDTFYFYNVFGWATDSSKVLVPDSFPGAKRRIVLAQINKQYVKILDGPFLILPYNSLNSKK